MKKLIEEAMAEVAGLPVKKHKNLLGNKNKYIDAIADKLSSSSEDKVLANYYLDDEFRATCHEIIDKLAYGEWVTITTFEVNKEKEK